MRDCEDVSFGVTATVPDGVRLSLSLNFCVSDRRGESALSLTAMTSPFKSLASPLNVLNRREGHKPRALKFANNEG